MKFKFQSVLLMTKDLQGWRWHQQNSDEQYDRVYIQTQHFSGDSSACDEIEEKNEKKIKGKEMQYDHVTFQMDFTIHACRIQGGIRRKQTHPSWELNVYFYEAK